jgi:RNA polymerase sigma-70 factor (ECF subfamily)
MLASARTTPAERVAHMKEETAPPERMTAEPTSQSLPETMIRDALPALLPRMRRMARALTGHAADADDLVQIALERALARATQWRPDGRADAWVFGILRNAWLDELRSRSRWQQVLAPEEAGEIVGEPAIERQTTVWSVAEAVGRLPPEQREVVALVLVEGLGYRETAELLGVPIGTVTSRLARARAALQAWLD